METHFLTNTFVATQDIICQSTKLKIENRVRESSRICSSFVQNFADVTSFVLPSKHFQNLTDKIGSTSGSFLKKGDNSVENNVAEEVTLT